MNCEFDDNTKNSQYIIFYRGRSSKEPNWVNRDKPFCCDRYESN